MPPKKKPAAKKPGRTTATKARRATPTTPAKKPAAPGERKAPRAKKAPPPQVALLPAPPPPLTLDKIDAMEERAIPGSAVDGARLSRAIRYAAKVTPKDGDLVFEEDSRGMPLVSGHDTRRCHTAYLPADSALHLRGAVPRASAIELADALDGLDRPRVRVDYDGVALIRHGAGQPAMKFRLAHHAITFAWRPPTQTGRTPAAGPLRIQASAQGAACKWSCAIVHTAQSADGIEWCTLTDEESGELLARAVLAEDGKDIFPEDDRQTEIPGSRTAGKSAVASALKDLTSMGPVQITTHVDGVTTTVDLPAGDTVPPVAAEAPDDVEVTVDGEPIVAAPSDRVTARISEAEWDALAPAAANAFSDAEGVLTEIEGTVGWVYADLTPAALATWRELAQQHGITVHEGAPPDASDVVDSAEDVG